MSLKLRPANLKDYHELVFMFKDLIETVYDGFEIGEDIFFYGVVQSWYQNKKDIIVCEKEDGTITGFSVAYIEDIGIVRPYYYGDLAYVKPKHRKGRTAFLLYNNVVDYAEKLKLSLVAKGFIGNEDENKVAQIQAKFGSPFFVEFKKHYTEGVKDE